jgi:glycosyltransferase involved in cell wall biosynthesis
MHERTIVKKRLRICIIAFRFAPIVGGAEIAAERLARELQDQGADVTVLTLRDDKNWPKQEVYQGLSVIRVGGTYSRTGKLRIGRLGHLPIDILAFRKLWHLRHQFDIIHLQQMSPLAGVAVLIGKLTKIPVIIRIPSAGPGKQQEEANATLMADTLIEKSTDMHFLKVPYTDIIVGGLSHLEITAVGGKFILDYLKKSDAYYHVLSTRCQTYLTSQGFRADHLVKIPNGIDTERFCPNPSVRPSPAQAERNIISVTRLEFPKGVDVLLHAWGRMMNAPAEWRAHLKPRLLLVGPGHLQTQLERIATELGISDSVEFLGLHREVIPLLQKAWGFILPSRWEGMPNALLEAMSCGIPSIATRVSGSEDIIEDGINGLLIEPEEPAQMAQALRRLIEDTELSQRLAEAGRATALREYQLSHAAERCLDFYYQALGLHEDEQSLVTAGIEG